MWIDLLQCFRAARCINAFIWFPDSFAFRPMHPINRAIKWVACLPLERVRAKLIDLSNDNCSFVAPLRKRPTITDFFSNPCGKLCLVSVRNQVNTENHLQIAPEASFNSFSSVNVGFPVCVAMLTIHRPWFPFDGKKQERKTRQKTTILVSLRFSTQWGQRWICTCIATLFKLNLKISMNAIR